MLQESEARKIRREREAEKQARMSTQEQEQQKKKSGSRGDSTSGSKDEFTKKLAAEVGNEVELSSYFVEDSVF